MTDRLRLAVMRSLMVGLTGALVLASAACGEGGGRRVRNPDRAPATHSSETARRRTSADSVSPRRPLQALITAPTEDQVLVVDIPSARVVKQMRVPGQPEDVAACTCGPPVVVGSASGSLTLLGGSFRPIRVFRGFASAPIAAMTPGGDYAYVADGASGKLAVIGLYDEKITSRIAVGQGAHHLAFSPDGQQVWVALGQAARTIAIVSTVVQRPSAPSSSPVVDPGRPHLIGRLDPGFLAHDVLFSPNGKEIWITSASSTYTGVFGARTHRLLFRVPAGRPPQHVAFAGRYAYLTSGYGGRIEQVDMRTGRVLKQAPTPYGSFDLAAADGYVVAVSLLRGTLAVYNRQLQLLRVRRLAPALEDVALVRP